MVVVSYSGKEINAKLVYYGPGLSGKTSNLEFVYQSVPSSNRGKMVSMKTRTERTLFFDFLPVDLGELGGFKTRFLLYTVPGQVYYNATRKLVLRGVDAIIFVADSQRGKMEENLESLQNLHDNLKEYGLSLDDIPMVIQYNKRDLPDVYSLEELNDALNPEGFPVFEGIATTGQGVFETFRGIARILLQKLSKEVKLAPGKGPTSGPAADPLAPVLGAPSTPSAPTPEPVPDPVSEPVSEIRLQTTDAQVPSAPEPTVETSKPFRPGSPPSPPSAKPADPAPLQVESIPSVTPSVPKPEPVPEVPVAKAPVVPPIVAPPQPDIPEPISAASPPVEMAPPPSPHMDSERGEALANARRYVPPVSSVPDPEKRGFWSKLFKRGQDDLPPAPPLPVMEPEAVMEPQALSETRLASVEIPAVGGSGDASPIYIERRIQVPITLGPEEVTRGAKLRLIMEINVSAGDSGTAEDEDSSKVA